MKRYFPFWIFPVSVLLAILTVWLRLSIVGSSYEIDQVNKMSRNSLHEAEKVELKVARLRSPSHLEELAKRKFKLGAPAAHQVVPMVGP